MGALVFFLLDSTALLDESLVLWVLFEDNPKFEDEDPIFETPKRGFFGFLLLLLFPI